MATMSPFLEPWCLCFYTAWQVCWAQVQIWGAGGGRLRLEYTTCTMVERAHLQCNAATFCSRPPACQTPISLSWKVSLFMTQKPDHSGCLSISYKHKVGNAWTWEMKKAKAIWTWLGGGEEVAKKRGVNQKSVQPNGWPRLLEPKPIGTNWNVFPARKSWQPKLKWV